MATKSNTQKKAMLQALEKTLGNVSEAAGQVGIARKTHYQWMNIDSEYKQSVESIADVALDFVEGKLFNLISGFKRTVITSTGQPVTIQDAPHPTAVIFYLKCKGKRRGYIERPTNEPEVQVNVSTGLKSIIDFGGGIVFEI